MMERYKVGEMARSIEKMTTLGVAAKAIVARNLNPDEIIGSPEATDLENMIKGFKDLSEQISLQNAADRCSIFSEKVRAGITFRMLGFQAETLIEAVNAELCHRQFVFIPSDRASLHDKWRKDWAEVLQTFPETSTEIEQALDCYVLDMNTASVFHLMRVVELGLRALCQHFGLLKLKSKKKSGRFEMLPIAHATWDAMLAKLQVKVDAKINNLRRGPARQKLQELYHPLMLDVRAIKDAWRNQAMHCRATYIAEEAAAIQRRVHDFMTGLACAGIKLR